MNDEKVNKLIRDFSSLPEEEQNHVLGIVQALAFAGYSQKDSEPEKPEEKDAENREQ